jgi:transmembrane sensor
VREGEEAGEQESSAEAASPDSVRAQSEAARWLAQLTSGEATDADLRAFGRWRAESSEHARAADELWSIWLHLEQIRPRRSNRRFGRPRMRYVAAGLAASLVVGFCAFRFWHDWRFDHVTSLGERAEVLLSDGTRVELNGDTALSVRFDGETRHVRVARGEAYFDVVHLPQPFVVESGAVRVRDLGTAFAVRQEDGQHIQVSVEHGEVEVQEGNRRAEIRAGQTAFSGPGVPLRAGQFDPFVDLAWRRGRLIIVDQTLASVVRTLERYRNGLFFISDPSAARLHVNAVVSLAHIDDWLLALPHAEPVRVVKLGPIVWIR